MQDSYHQQWDPTARLCEPWSRLLMYSLEACSTKILYIYIYIHICRFTYYPSVATVRALFVWPESRSEDGARPHCSYAGSVPYLPD